MEAKKSRLTLNLDPHFERRLKTTVELRGISMVQYYHAAFDMELAKDEAKGIARLPFSHEAIDRLAALREATFGGESLPRDSAVFNREERESRSNPQT